MSTETFSFLDLRQADPSDEGKSVKYTLNGLLEGRVGMLIAAPSIGKSHFMLSLAIEHASSERLVGLSASPTPQKTLYLSSEDSIEILTQRIQDKASDLSQKTLAELDTHLDIMICEEPLVINSSAPEQSASHERFLVELEQRFSEYSLVIIDTVTESIGECDEVKDDRKIKNTFSRLANKSGASVVLVHHVNKSEIHGLQKITMASGAGLTSIMRLAKFLVALTHDGESLVLKFLKSNYLSKQESQDIPLSWNRHLLTSAKVDSECSVMSAPPQEAPLDQQTSTVAPVVKAKKSKRVSSRIKNDPRSIKIRGIDKKDSKEDDMRNVL